MAEFPTLELGDDWGPRSSADIPLGLLYQPFSKTDRVERAADFVHGYRRDKHTTRAAQKAQEEHKSFKLVDDTQIRKYGQHRRPNRRHHRRHYVENKEQSQHYLQRNRNKDRDRQRLEMRYINKWKKTAARRLDKHQRKNIDTDYKVGASWEVIKDIPFSKLKQGVSLEVPKPVDVYKAGSVPYLDRTLESVRPKMPTKVVLPKNRAPQNGPTAFDDPILQKHAEVGTANVFATDDVLAYLMSASRSFYPFEIIVTKIEGRVYLDKRQGGPIDTFTIDENALRPPMEDDDGHRNHPKRLNREITALNRFYRAQTLQDSKVLAPASMGNSDPFKGKRGTFGYRYRTWELPGGNKMMVRCQHDAICVEKIKGKTSKHFVSIKALLEYGNDMYKDGWRKQLETRKGTVLVSAMKDNSCLFSRWIVASLLSSNKEIKIAYISRRDPKIATSHLILGVETLSTAQAARQMDIKLSTGFAIVATLVHNLMQEEDGDYVIARKAGEQSIKLLRVAEDSEDEEEEEEDSEEEGVLDEDL